MPDNPKKDKPLSTHRSYIQRLSLPDIPQNHWCDFRRDYESGLSLKAIAQKYVCDPRTVRTLMNLNKGSAEIGKQRAPTVLTKWLPKIRALYQELSDEGMSICIISRHITEQLKKEGYRGTERTIRNYLRTQYFVIPDPDVPDE